MKNREPFSSKKKIPILFKEISSYTHPSNPIYNEDGVQKLCTESRAPVKYKHQ